MFACVQCRVSAHRHAATVRANLRGILYAAGSQGHVVYACMCRGLPRLTVEQGAEQILAVVTCCVGEAGSQVCMTVRIAGGASMLCA